VVQKLTESRFGISKFGIPIEIRSLCGDRLYLKHTNALSNEQSCENPEPTHPARDPTTQPASLIWPQKADTGAWWEEEEGQEYIQKHFSVKHIAKYFRTRSPVSAADIDGWRARELMAPLFMGDDEELQALIRDHLILPYLFGRFAPLPHSRICRRTFNCARETGKPRRFSRWSPAHHLRRKLAALSRQPCRRRCPGSYF